MISTTSLSARREILARAILGEVHSAGKRPFTNGQSERIDQYREEISRIDQEISGDAEVRYQQIFDKWLGSGKQNRLSPIEQSFFESRATVGLEGLGGGAYPSSTAGYLAPIEYAREVVAAMKYAGALPEVCKVDIVDNGRTKAYPTVSDTSEDAAIVTEGGSLSVADITAGAVYLDGARLNTTIKMSLELTQDVVLDGGLPSFLNTQFGRRIGRSVNNYGTTGTGSGQPLGFITALGSAAVTVTGADANDGASNSHNSIGTADFSALESSVDYGYRLNACWMANPSVIASLKGQLDKQGRFLFPGLQTPEQTVNGYPMKANPALSPYPTSPGSPTVSYPVLAFGDFSRMTLKISRPLYVMLKETYAANLQVGYSAFVRYDCGLLDTAAIAYAQVVY